MSRIPDIIDVWIDSGTASWNSLHYPSREDYFEKFFPADLILEATEQTRLWFSMLQICSTIMFGKKAYVGAYNHGMILDFQGLKMSKSLGNIISPYEIIDKFSSEILRYYICETSAGKNINFNWEDVKQKQRNLLVLLNTANYLIQLKGNYKKQENEIEEKYILSKLNSIIKEVTSLFNNYQFDKTITQIERLFLNISRIYIRLTRDKANENPSLVYQTLHEVYIKTLTMFSTICPLFTEKIYQNLRENKIINEESVHITSDKLNVELETKITPELEAEGFVREISRKIQAERKNANLIKNDSIDLVITSDFNNYLEKFEKEIAERVGAKNLSFKDNNKKYDHLQVGKIKGRDFSIKFNKL